MEYNFKEHKFSVNAVLNLLSTAKNHQIPTDLQMQKAMNVFNKDYLLGLTATDVNDLLIVIKKQVEFSVTKPPKTVQHYLYEYYTDVILGISRLYQFEEDSARQFQVNGTKNEPEAFRILSEYTGIEYKKNKIQFENDFFIGKPDILVPNGVSEVKTVANYADFMKLKIMKPTKEAQYQLQLYLDLTEQTKGEIVCVATGLSKERREEYIAYGKEFYKRKGWSDEKSGKLLLKLEKDSNLDHIPLEKRIITYPYKRNPEMIKFAKSRVRYARGFLAKIDSNYENSVALYRETEEKQENI